MSHSPAVESRLEIRRAGRFRCSFSQIQVGRCGLTPPAGPYASNLREDGSGDRPPIVAALLELFANKTT